MEILVSLKFLVSQSMQFSESYSKVCCLQKVLHLLAVGIEAWGVELDVGWEDPVDDLALSGRSQTGVPGLADNLTQRLGNSCNQG